LLNAIIAKIIQGGNVLNKNNASWIWFNLRY